MFHSSLFPPLPDVPPQNVHNILFHRPEQASWPDFTLYINALTSETCAYRQFLEFVRDGATALSSDVHLGGLGIRPGGDELVGILSENSMVSLHTHTIPALTFVWDFIALFHALLVMTVPSVMFSSYASPFEFQHHSALARPTRLFVSRALLPMALVSGLPDDRIYVLDDDVEGRVGFGQLVARARTDGWPRSAVQPAEKDTLAYLAFSSGTSGMPKAVMISHGNLIKTFFQLSMLAQETVRAKGPLARRGPIGEVIFNVLPIHHSAGLHVAAFRCFAAPTTIALLSQWSIDAFFYCIPKYRVTMLSLVPSLIQQIVHHPRFHTTDFSSVRIIRSGAAHLPVSLAEQFCSRFPGVDQVVEGYGLTETTLIVSSHPVPGMLGGRAKYVPDSLGILVAGVEARIVREDGELAAVNEPGDLYVRSDTVALGYWKNPEATRETFKDGWVRTGDRMRIDPDGVLYFEDRVKDTLKVSGMQVSPTEIEDTLLKHPEGLITDACVAGVSGGRTDDERIPRAWVVLSPRGDALGASDVASKLEVWIQETLSRYKWLRGGIGIVKEIPKSPTGKTLRRVLVEVYEVESRTRPVKL